MYRCTECQAEYKEKPEYCNCGNDEFEEIIEIQNQTPKSSLNKEPTFESTNGQKLFLINKLFPISFLVICIIISISIWLIKIPANEKSAEKNIKTSTTNDIPTDVENFWKDTTPLNATPETPVSTTTTEQHSQKNTSPSQKTNSTTTQKPQTKPQTKTTNPPKTIIPKPVQTAKPKSNNNNKPATSTNNKQTPQKPKLPDSVLNVGKSSPQTQTVSTTQTAQTAPKPFNYKPAPKMDEEEFLKYKGEIRSALLSKLNVAAIQGSGECAVEFSLDKTGKLINRIFVYKSSNKSVNDEVYLMLMRLPYFKNPPKYYNSEKIRLKFYFNNGYYEITFI